MDPVITRDPKAWRGEGELELDAEDILRHAQHQRRFMEVVRRTYPADQECWLVECWVQIEEYCRSNYGWWVFPWKAPGCCCERRYGAPTSTFQRLPFSLERAEKLVALYRSVRSDGLDVTARRLGMDDGRLLQTLSVAQKYGLVRLINTEAV